jgi:hypothetical protein
VGQIAHPSPHRRIALFHKTPLSILVLEKKNPQATERRSPAGVPRLIIDAAANGSGGVFLLCIPSGFDLGTPGFQDNRVCRFHFSLRLEKIGENSWGSSSSQCPPEWFIKAATPPPSASFPSWLERRSRFIKPAMARRLY